MTYTKKFAYSVMFFCTTNLIALNPSIEELRLKKEEEQMQAWFDQMQKYKTLDILDKNQKEEFKKMCSLKRPMDLPLTLTEDSLPISIRSARRKDSGILKNFFNRLGNRLTNHGTLDVLKRDIGYEVERVNRAIIVEIKINNPRHQLDKWYTTINTWHPRAVSF